MSLNVSWQILKMAKQDHFSLMLRLFVMCVWIMNENNISLFGKENSKHFHFLIYGNEVHHNKHFYGFRTIREAQKPPP